MCIVHYPYIFGKFARSFEMILYSVKMALFNDIRLLSADINSLFNRRCHISTSPSWLLKVPSENTKRGKMSRLPHSVLNVNIKLTLFVHACS